ncbi:hypothetical protein WA1_46130 [Scytonema hofmannii PCC 7110]|uniref:CHAT domain-containing protein n=1 Tax=Scytonema hofmannii PCC 7110 TaxID=128403 RepID=A0A139WX58_9CYAN|nr:CHAT domain-containing protein [Scytonema hofmannii]KYC37027.1 hypothetical protein WA1_46130 [Scytonema hofmannii PCC 7110]
MIKKILILSANPKNTSKLRLDEEVREIQAGLERAKAREQFEIITRWAVRIEDLYRALLDYQPQIVHFSGHGVGSDGLALENNSGELQLVSTQSLAGLFELFKETIECVFLNACYSETQAEAIHQHINYVVGMSQTINDRAAIDFAKGFYDALGAGKSYEFAYKFGCHAIALQGISELEAPVLKSRESAVSVNSATNSNQESNLGNTKERSTQENQQESALPNINQQAGDNAIQFGHIGQAGNLNFHR